MAKEVVNTTTRIKIAGNAIVLTSKLKFETIQKMENTTRMHFVSLKQRKMKKKKSLESAQEN